MTSDNGNRQQLKGPAFRAKAHNHQLGGAYRHNLPARPIRDLLETMSNPAASGLATDTG